MSEPYIRTYYSSQTESLLESLLFQLENDATSPVNTPFGRAVIVVPNSGMQRYLELNIAQRFGICSHIDIGYIGQLLAKTYATLLADAVPAHIDERLLTFALLRLWDKRIFPLDVAFEKRFQQHKHARQRYLFAHQIATLLRQYLNERPEMIDAWQSGKQVTEHVHEVWQRDMLQQALTLLGISHTSRLQRQACFVEALQTTTEHDLPTIVHVFGFHAVPASQLDDLFALGHATQVIFYTFNPCIGYWLDIVPEKVKARLDITHADEAMLMTVGHPLLASWGQSGKYYLQRLNDYYAPNLDDVVKPEVPTSVLTWLQQDIRELTTDDTIPLSELFAGETTPSLTIHACANPRREVEVLYDNLCHAFETSDLAPADVLVIVPQLQEYAPHIHAIFSHTPSSYSTGQSSNDKPEYSIPFSVADQSTAETEPDVQAFLALLDTIDSDFQAQVLFDCLSEARVQAGLNLSQSDLDHLRYWFAESRFSLHFYDNNEGKSSSLEKLLDSLLLAAVGGEGTELGNRQASSLYHAGQLTPLTQLCELWQRFVPFVRWKQQSLTLSAWCDQFRALAAAFLPLRHTMDEWLNVWYQPLAELDARDEQPSVYDFTTVRADLLALLQNGTLHGPFLSGGVSFCAIVPMRSIPAKMIAVLGLNSDFPTVAAKDPLDLRLANPRWSDRNAHKEQQYFFLETLMAARERLYLSHVGLDEKTGKMIPPSALVRELFGYLEHHLPKFEQAVTTYYPLQGFINEASYQTLYATPELPVKAAKNPLHDAIHLPDSLTANQLAAMLVEPLAAFWRYHLQAQPLDQLTEPLAAHEFIANESGLDTWHAKQNALAIGLHGDTFGIINELQQHNRYAPAAISDALLATAQASVQPLLTTLNELTRTDMPNTIEQWIKHHVGGQSIYLRLHATKYATQGLLSYEVSSLNAKKQLHAWITHVLYHCLPDASACPSILLTLDKNRVEQTVFTAFSNRVSAFNALDQLLAVAHAVIQQPYAMQLIRSGKKGDTLWHYDAVDYSLYSQIAQADASSIAALQRLWVDVDTTLQRHRGSP